MSCKSEAKQAVAFWPGYDDIQTDLKKIGDASGPIVTEYSANPRPQEQHTDRLADDKAVGYRGGGTANLKRVY
jgi:hypothetical protein